MLEKALAPERPEYRCAWKRSVGAIYVDHNLIVPHQCGHVAATPVIVRERLIRYKFALLPNLFRRMRIMVNLDEHHYD